jgi:hypothetical protein
VTSYAVVIERASDGGYGAWSPDLPGVVALADTEAETLEEMRKRSSSISTVCARTGNRSRTRRLSQLPL